VKNVWRDPWARAAVVLALFVVAGFVVIGLAWSGAASRGYAVYQLPWVVSGGMVGIALVGLGIGLLDLHIWRRDAAVRRGVLGEVVRDTSELTEAIAARVLARRAAAAPPAKKPAKKAAEKPAKKPAKKAVKRTAKTRIG